MSNEVNAHQTYLNEANAKMVYFKRRLGISDYAQSKLKNSNSSNFDHDSPLEEFFYNVFEMGHDFCTDEVVKGIGQELASELKKDKILTIYNADIWKIERDKLRLFRNEYMNFKKFIMGNKNESPKEVSHDEAAFALNKAKDKIREEFSDNDIKISSNYLKSKMNRAVNFQKFLDSGGDIDSYQKGYIEGLIDACMILGI